MRVGEIGDSIKVESHQLVAGFKKARIEQRRLTRRARNHVRDLRKGQA